MLLLEGFKHFKTATNGLAALEYMISCRATHEQLPILMILDLHMPCMDGFEACDYLRKLNFTLPICALSAAVDLDTRTRCHQLGFSYVLTKPITQLDLTTVLRQLILSQ